MSNAKNLIDIWNVYSNQVLMEKASNKKSIVSLKPGPGMKNLNDKKAGDIDQAKTTGPAAASGFNAKIIDTKTMSDKEKKDNAYNIKSFTLQDEKFDQDIQKTTNVKINNNMKSTFDKLFEDVIGGDDPQDLKALGIPGHEGENGDESNAEAPADVSIQLSQDQVECLRAILAQVDGQGSDESPEGDDGSDGLNSDQSSEPKEEQEEVDDYGLGHC